MQKTILVIDDDPVELDIMNTLLTSTGYTTLVAEDGESGVARAIFARPDLILLDAMMPGISGFETCRRLRENEVTTAIPIIFKTCLASDRAVFEAIRSGVDDYVIKPCNHETLLSRIKAKIGSYRLDNIEAIVSASQDNQPPI